MTDHDFAALQRRLAPALAAGSSREYRREVEALLAECRRLREPPDVSGLMTAAELGEARRLLYDGGRVRTDFLDRLFGHIDAQAAHIRELYGVVADLHADDPGRQALLGRGAAEMLYRVLALVRESFGDPAAADYPELAGTLGRLRALGPARPPLPPSEAEREAERLREALRGCVEALDVYTDVGHDQYPGPVFDAIDAARAALKEDAR